MKVNNFMNLSKPYVKIANKTLKEGELLEGEILDSFDNLVIVDIKGLGVIRAYAQNGLSGQKGQKLTFIVKTSLPNKVEIKPMFINVEEKENLENSNKSEDYLAKILKEYNIKEDPISIELLDNLMKYNAEINKENIIAGIKILDKLEQLINFNSEEAITIANNEIEEDFKIAREDIRNFIIIDKNEINSNIDLTSAVRENLNQIIEDKISEPMALGEDVNQLLNSKLEIIRIISFFIKFNIKPTINNIKYFQKVKENSDLLSDNLKKIEDAMTKDFKEFNKKVIIGNKSSENIVETNIVKQKEVLDKVIDYMKKYNEIDSKEFKTAIKELEDKIDFLKEMNKELIFIYLPLKLKYDSHNNAIKFLKKKKEEKSFSDKTNILINLNTKRLGNIKIYCEVSNRSMNIKIGNIAKEDLYLFKSNENKLKLIIEYTGYKLNSIEYSLEENIDILDALIVNKKLIYNLDVQV